MKKYRIRIIERNNGEVCYIPQVYFSNKNITDWFNIIFIINPLNLYNPLSTDILKYVQVDFTNDLLKEHYCKNEEDALKMINQLKTQFGHEEGFKIKSETFKEVL